jgi:hypothetical protein
LTIAEDLLGLGFRLTRGVEIVTARAVIAMRGSGFGLRSFFFMR